MSILLEGHSESADLLDLHFRILWSILQDIIRNFPHSSYTQAVGYHVNPTVELPDVDFDRKNDGVPGVMTG